MARIVVGNRDGTLAIRHGRQVLERLTEEWPDLHLTLRTVPNPSVSDSSALLAALAGGQIGVAVTQVDSLPLDLPEGLKLAAVLRRPDARSALVARGGRSLAQLDPGAVVGVYSERDAAFVKAANPLVETLLCRSQPESELGNLASGAYLALVVSVAALAGLDLRDRVDAVLDPEEFAPAAGQGAVALVVREDDDLAFESVYPLQHRPSFDRVRAELAFAKALAPEPCGALAHVSDDGELTLFGAAIKGEAVVQANVTGEPREAEDLGRELAQGVVERLKAL